MMGLSHIKSTVIVAIFLLLASCAHKKTAREMSKEELSQMVMKESMLASSLHNAIDTSSTCLKPFLAGMKKEHAEVFLRIMGESFKYDELYRAVESRWKAAITNQELLRLAEDFETDEWKAFRKSIKSVTPADSEAMGKMLQQLEAGTFDVNSRRTAIVAAITEQSYNLNLLKISNNHVRKLVTKKVERLPARQKNAVEWFKRDLDTYESAAKRQLFITNYYMTRDLDEYTLKKVSEIRGSLAYIEGRKIFEDEFNSRLKIFFDELNKSVSI